MTEQKIMSKVMKLLELANDPNATEAERKLAGEHAERLMAQHMIDRMDLKAEEPSKVIQDTWSIRTGDVDTEFRYHLRYLMEQVLTHCGARVHPRPAYAKKDDGTRDYRVQEFIVVGFPEDMMYAEQIWFRVFKGFVDNISPKWDPAKPLSENVYAFIKAGYSWIDTYRIGRRTQFNDWPEKMPNGGPRLRTAYKEALEVRGESFTKTRTREAYRATFVRSYGSKIGRRLSDMRAKVKENVSSADKFALAIRSTKERVDEEFYRLFPEFDPEVRRKMREAEEFEAACEFAALTPEEQARAIKEQATADAKWEKASRRAYRGYSTVRTKATYDQAAWERGNKVAGKVNLNVVDPEMNNRKKRELNG